MQAQRNPALRMLRRTKRGRPPTSPLPAQLTQLFSELRGSSLDETKIGSSGLAGVHTKVLFGDPAKPGFYTILLFVDKHTTIQAHSHRDDRMAAVVSGQWQIGYGDHFDDKPARAAGEHT